MLGDLIPGEIGMRPVLLAANLIELIMHFLAFLLYFLLLLIARLALVLCVFLRQRRASETRFASELPIVVLVCCRVSIWHDRQRQRRQELSSTKLTWFIIGRKMLGWVRDFTALTIEEVIECPHRNLLRGELSFLTTCLKILADFGTNLCSAN